MAHQTETEHIKSAKKPHMCSWCGERIEPGQPYDRWRWFDGVDTSVVKVHPECYRALNDLITLTGDAVEFSPGDNPRGCNCGFDRSCDHSDYLESA